MKNRKRRLLCGVLCAVMLFASAGSVLAVSCTNYSDWFKPSYNEMNELNLIPSEFAGYDLKKNITRGEMSVLAVHAYGLITKNAIELERTDYFSDTTDKTILEAYELGIVSGYPDYHTFRFNCVGSVGYAFRDILTVVAEEFGMKTGRILQAPMEGLIDYHTNRKTTPNP